MSAKTFEVGEDEEGMRLDRWFKRRMPTLSLSHLNKIVRTGEVRVDGARVMSATRLVKGQRVRVPPLKLDAPVALAREISQTDLRALQDMILYEDRDLLVLDKPFGLAVQGGSGMTRHIDGMLASMPNERGDRPVLVHRLDRDTSGVLLVAKTRSIAADLGEIFRSRQARKIYWALVEGVPKPAQGRISLYLAKGEGMGQARPARCEEEGRGKLEKMRVARHGDEDARHSVTYYAIVDKIASRLAWLSLKPITGRTHQLRAHCAAIGTPIFGDGKYGGAAAHLDGPPGSRRLHLHARALAIPHPQGGILRVTAPLPPHMRQSWEFFGFPDDAEDPFAGLDLPQ